jgi:release factor glutamine methyltransferase
LNVLIVPRNTKYNCVEDLLAEGKQFLAENHIASTALDASLLLGEAAGLTREKLITRNNAKLDESQCKRYFELLKRRCAGESVAYILGRKKFWGLEISVTPAVLVPRPETEILVEAALSILRSYQLPTPRSPILDLCTGSGAVAIALKHECPGSEIFAADISEDALGVARSNAKKHGCEITFFHSDLFNALIEKSKEKSRFFLITANAPYIPSSQIDLLSAEVRHEPRLALDGGSDGLDIIRRIIAEAPLYLKTGGYLVLEADPSQMEAIAVLLKDSGFSKVVLYKDLAGENRVISGCKK